MSTTSAGNPIRLVRIALLVACFAIPATLMREKSATSDEVAHLPAGASYLKTGTVSLNPMHPPLVKELCALPLVWLGVKLPADDELLERHDLPNTFQWEFGKRFFEIQDGHRLLLLGRIPAILLSVGLASLVAIWATRLWGAAGGVLALFLYAFDPTIIAHAQLVTTDVGLAFFATLFLFSLRRFVAARTIPGCLVAGLALGLALGAKFSGVVLVPIAAALLALGARRDRRSLLRGVAPLGAMTVVAYGVLWLIYLCPADPLFYWHGLTSVGEDHNPTYEFMLLGERSTKGWPWYMLVAWLVKTPIPSLLVIATGAWLFFRGRRSSGLEEAFLLLPAAGFFAVASFGAAPIGVRYLIPAFPFLFMFAGRVLSAPRRLSRAGAAVLAALALWLVAEIAAIWPDHISYFNQIAGGSRGGVRWLDDSNVDWGQGLIQLRRHLEGNPVGEYRLCYYGRMDPAFYGVSGESFWIDKLLTPPTPGTLVLSAHCVAQARSWLDRAYGEQPGNWLAHAEPKTIVGHAYWIYEIER